MPIEQRMDKKDMDKEDNISYTMEYYPIIEKNELMLFTATMDGPRDYYTKWRSQIEKDKYHMISLICDICGMWNLCMSNLLKKLYKLPYLQNRNRLTDVVNKLMITKRERGEE